MAGDSKESIKSRMIRTASGLWGYPDTQDINSFDPIVGMIMGAVAEELHSISGEINKTDARIIEKLHELLFHQHEFTHFPAHAIVKARPTQPQVTVSESFQFSHIRKIQRSDAREALLESKTIYFTPTADVNLFRGDVRFLQAGNQLYGYKDLMKEQLAVVRGDGMTDYSRIYVGIKFDNLIEKLDGFTLMFSTRNNVYEERFYHALNNAQWKINGQVVAFRKGFELAGSKEDNPLMEIFREESDISYKTCRFVNRFYSKRFMMVEEKEVRLKSLEISEYLPAPFYELFPPHVLKGVDKDLSWVEIILPQPLPQEVLSEVQVAANCFPVINRELNEFSQSLGKGTNVVPLATSDLFFDIRKISDSSGTVYRPLNSYGSHSNKDEGAYIVRQGGIARFDSRDAKETISQMIDLLRDERAGFAVLGADMISSELKQIDQIISRLKQRIEAAKISNETGVYLLLDCKSGPERANIQYWTTTGELANNIRADSRLTLHKGRDIDNNSLVFMTNTTGGRQKLSGEEKMNKLRRTILTRGRVVTPEDIKAVCFDHFGPDLQRVEVKKGILADPSLKKGLVRSVDVHLFLRKQTKLNAEEQGNKSEALKISLQQESVNLLPYRIVLHQGV